MSAAGSVERLGRAFARPRAEGRKALVVYLTAGDPSRDEGVRLMHAAARAGADVLEVGMPWSDPSADGPVIQAAMARALAAGGGIDATLAAVADLRAGHPDLGIVLFGYANPIVQRGLDRFAAQAREAGADGVLCVDWPAAEDATLAQALAAAGLASVPLLAPTTSPERAARIAATAGGFLYYVSMTGITGAALPDLAPAAAHVAALRAATGGRLPVAVGFGVASPDDARRVAAFADAVVVGSAAIRACERARAEGRDAAAALGTFVGELRAALRGAA